MKLVKRLVICCPGEHFSSRWVKSFTHMVLSVGARYDLEIVPPMFDFCTNPYSIRNILAEEAQRFEPDYVLWIDDDNPFVPDRFDRLWNSLLNLKAAAMVAGWSWCETDQYESGAFLSCGRFREDLTCQPLSHREVIGQTEPIPVDYTGFPAVLMHGWALDLAGKHPFSPFIDPAFEHGYSGEDYAFCRRLKAVGQKVYVDPLCQLPHLKLRAITPAVILERRKEKECAA